VESAQEEVIAIRGIVIAFSCSRDVISCAQLTAVPPLKRTILTAAMWLTIWLAPLLILTAALGVQHVFVREGWFFSVAATLTFGGAYAVLAYVAQAAVENYAWLRPGEMLDGLGLAETTPGPLILVVMFVGYLGAFRQPGALPPAVSGCIGALVTIWVTFIPSYLYIFVGAPYIERLRSNNKLTAALNGVTAAVVGVIANLAVWFTLHVLFGTVAERSVLGLSLLLPELETFDPYAALIAAAATAVLWRFKQAMMWVIAGATGLGCLFFMLR
jgi:chromate transporter